MPEFTKRTREEVEALMLSRRQFEGGCWIFDGAHHTQGYRTINLGGHPKYAHRIAHELWIGPIPTGHQIDHLCRERACFNPAHLEAVTQAVNLARGLSPTAINGRKTHCSHGHEFNAENTYIRKDTGGRVCRPCARRRRQMRSKRAAA